MASKGDLSEDRRFQELCAHLRTTDDISFKLLGLVPLVSAAGIATVFLKAEPRLSAFVYFVSLFASTVTLAFFIWERRNIQTCKWLRDRAAELEASAIDGSSDKGHFVGFPRSPLGKTEAEKVVYAATVFAWLALPRFVNVPLVVNGQTGAVPNWLPTLHGAFVWLLGTATVILILLPVKAEVAEGGRAPQN
jgi:hypothetical protein